MSIIEYKPGDVRAVRDRCDKTFAPLSRRSPPIGPCEYPKCHYQGCGDFAKRLIDARRKLAAPTDKRKEVKRRRKQRMKQRGSK